MYTQKIPVNRGDKYFSKIRYFFKSFWRTLILYSVNMNIKKVREIN
jgi:hypothetical protein